MLAKAADLAGIGSNIADVNSNIAADTTEVPPAAADQVSALVANMFQAHAQEYQSIGGQMSAVHDQIVQTLISGAGAYATAEAVNAARVGADAVNAPIQSLLGGH
ncbi:hypothetical protein A9W95_05535 [Mycobacterium sp. 1423905.2]|nr:hypothetical protein A9W95_05535 [Mycobacterium sp. 1423905.2]